MMRDRLLQAHLRDIGRFEIPDRDEELDLIRRAQAGDWAARNLLASRHARFVVFVARGYARRYHRRHLVDILELSQEGYFGLLRAIDTFDPSRGYRFLSYAVTWITKMITAYMAESTESGVRLPHRRVRQVKRIRNAADRVMLEEGRHLTVDEMIEAGGLADGDVPTLIAILGAAASPETLDSTLCQSRRGYGDEEDDDSDRTLQDLLPDTSDTPEDALLREEMHQRLAAALTDLDPCLRTIVVLHFGLNGEDPASFREIGKRVGFSHEWARELLGRALDQLRKKLS